MNESTNNGGSQLCSPSTARPLPQKLPSEATVPVDPTRPLRPQLDKIEDKIEQSLDQVCSSPSVKQIDTGELIKIEETLAIAAEAAKEAVSLRRRMRRDREASGSESEQQPGA